MLENVGRWGLEMYLVTLLDKGHSAVASSALLIRMKQLQGKDQAEYSAAVAAAAAVLPLQDVLVKIVGEEGGREFLDGFDLKELVLYIVDKDLKKINLYKGLRTVPPGDQL